MDLLTKSDKESDKTTLSVSAFIAAARQTVEDQIATCWIAGEVTNFTRAASGHWYFALRDPDAQVDCVMFRQFNSVLPAPLNEGDAVEVLAQASIYAPRGRFQLMAKMVRHTGDGKWYQLFIQRKKEWAARGWFDSDAKKPLPPWPHTVGVVSSTAGAALQDVLRTLKTRMPSIHVIVYPAPAQGADAADKIAAAIRTANRRKECQTLIVCRGGGGIEDLQAFNEEAVVSAIVDSHLPVVTGIGHEIDETLADLAADVRAPTPTGAAVAASPDHQKLQQQLRAAAAAFARASHRKLMDETQRLDSAIAALIRPSALLRDKTDLFRQQARTFVAAANATYAEKQSLLRAAVARFRPPDLQPPVVMVEQLASILTTTTLKQIQTADMRLQRAETILRACDPQHTLARGYSIVKNASGKIIQTSSALQPKEELQLTFSEGGASAEVKSIINTAKKNKKQKEIRK